MRTFLAAVFIVIMLGGLALQLRTYASATPEVKARMRTGLVIQTIAVAVLVVVDLMTIMS